MKCKLITPVKLSVFGFFLILSTQFAYSQSANKLYMAMPDIGPTTKDFIKTNNIPTVPVLSSKDMSPTGEPKLDVETFTKAIISHIPDSNATGYAVIDWEGKISVNLIFSAQSSDEYQNALAEYTKAIKLAKQLRPHMTWGFFGIPFQPFKNDKRPVNIEIPLLDLCDAFYPQLYFDYNADKPNGHRSKSEKDAWISFNLSNVLAIAQKMGNKPVLGFVWHRYYGGPAAQNLRLIPLNEFDDYIKEVLASNYNGKSVDGVIWWGVDSYYYSIKTPTIVDELNSSGTQNFEAYHDALIYKYIQQVYKVTNSAN
jgi:hypothetical protein